MGKTKINKYEYPKWGSATPDEVEILDLIEEHVGVVDIKEARKDIRNYYNLRSTLTENYRTAYVHEGIDYLERMVAKRDLNENVEKYSKTFLKMFNKQKLNDDKIIEEKHCLLFPSPLFYGEGDLLSLKDTISFIKDEPFDDTFLLHAEQNIYDCYGMIINDSRKQFLVNHYKMYFKGTGVFDKQEQQNFQLSESYTYNEEEYQDDILCSQKENAQVEDEENFVIQSEIMQYQNGQENNNASAKQESVQDETEILDAQYIDYKYGVQMISSIENFDQSMQSQFEKGQMIKDVIKFPQDEEMLDNLSFTC